MITVKITDLSVKTIIGTKKQEREKPQEILISLSFDYDAEKAITGDDLNQSIDYEALSNKITSKVETSKFYLLEKLADYILKIILSEKSIKDATVLALKPNALENAKSVSVLIQGSNKG